MVARLIKKILQLTVNVLWRFRVMVAAAILCILVFVLLQLAESHLRAAGNKPGVIGDLMHFNRVDSLRLRDDYSVDEEGILRFSDASVNFLQAWCASERSPLSMDSLWRDPHREYTVKLTARENLKLRFCTDSVNSPLARLITSGKAGSEKYGMIQQWLAMPVNAEGYRSIPFQYAANSGTRVLLLGDSFTFGVSADPLSACFADRLLGYYLVYNAGIVGADPAQYLAIAKRWIPILRPDVVVVNFFMGNDPMHYYRQPRKSQPAYHVTNAGWLWAIPHGCWKDAASVYQELEDQVILPMQRQSAFNRFCAGTVLGTRLWMFLHRQGWVTSAPADTCKEKYYGNPVSEVYLSEIRAICERNQSRFLISVIPDYKQLGHAADSLISQNFEGLAYSLPQNLETADYNPDPDGHFNNKGHEKFAAFLHEEIEKLLRPVQD